MESEKPEVTKDDQLWVVRLKDAAQNVIEYRYASERQARYFAAVFELGPRTLPPAGQVARPARKSRRRARKELPPQQPLLDLVAELA